MTTSTLEIRILNRCTWKAAMPVPIPTASREGEMTSEMTTSWALLLGLGVFHGINPGMGWLFAVALGMQERSHTAIYKALLPLMGGHALAIAIAVALAMLAGAVVPLRAIQWTVSGVLLALGLSRVFKHAHPRWVRMQVGLRDLTIWSFLTASAHGAGLMVLPVVIGGAVAPTII